MRQVVCAITPFQTPDGRQVSMPPEAVESAVVRLRTVCVVCAVITALSIIVQRWLQPEVAVMMGSPVFSLLWLAVVLAALGIGAIQHFELLAATTILDLGLVFEVLVSFAISFSETSIQLPAKDIVLGTSKLAVWIAVVGLLIPNQPHVKLATALVSAST